MPKTLTQIRKESKKSKRKFAIEMGIPYTTYLRYENNIGNAPLREVKKICEKVGISIDELELNAQKQYQQDAADP